MVYTLGERVDAAPAVRPYSVGAFIARAVHLVLYCSPFLKLPFVDLHADARSLTCDHISFGSFMRCMWRSSWSESRDAGPFDVTFMSADEREAALEGVPNESTFYRSYTACMVSAQSRMTLLSRANRLQTSPTACGKSVRPTLNYALTSPAFYMLSRAMCSFNFSKIRPVPSAMQLSSDDPERGIQDSPLMSDGQQHMAFRANDGVVPLFSQWHPFNCRYEH